MIIGPYLAVAYGLAAYAIYLVSLAIYRLYFSPLAKFPGPKLAALSNWYEFYYDVLKEGDFTWHIQKLHREYGKTWTSLTSVGAARKTRWAETRPHLSIGTPAHY